jgi:hypothetical protein
MAAVICAKDWQHLSRHLSDERLHDLRILLGECPGGFGAKFVTEIRALLHGSEPGHAFVLALARLLDDAEHNPPPVTKSTKLYITVPRRSDNTG